jgi:hypothetical protein
MLYGLDTPNIDKFSSLMQAKRWFDVAHAEENRRNFLHPAYRNIPNDRFAVPTNHISRR